MKNCVQIIKNIKTFFNIQVRKKISFQQQNSL